jgi:hypothetical protein
MSSFTAIQAAVEPIALSGMPSMYGQETLLGILVQLNPPVEQFIDPPNTTGPQETINGYRWPRRPKQRIPERSKAHSG